MGKIMINGESYPSYVVKTGVDDTGIFEDKAWSSKKTSDEIAKVDTELNAKLDELSTYSTEETKVGTWIDGKPIYRKVIVLTFGLPPGGSKTLTLSNFGVNNVETPISSTIITSDGGYLGVRDVNVLTSFKTTALDIVIMSSGYSLGSGEQKIIIEYTKTTDA